MGVRWGSLLLGPHGGGGERDKNRDTREGCGTASVPPPQVEPKRGESYLVLRLVCAPVSWRVSRGCPGCVGGPGLWPFVPVLSVCPVASCAPGLVASSGCVSGTCFFLCFCFEASAQGTVPKTVFSTGTPFYSQGNYDLLGRGTCGFLRSSSPSVRQMSYHSNVAASLEPSVAAAAVFPRLVVIVRGFLRYFQTRVVQWAYCHSGR